MTFAGCHRFRPIPLIRCLVIRSLGMLSLICMLAPVWAEPQIAPDLKKARDAATVSTGSPVSPVTTDELLKNFMASMTYTPSSLALPTDPVLPVPYPLSETPSDGSDSELALPDPILSVKPLWKPGKRKRLSFGKPVLNAALSSGFGLRWGRMHEGIDLAVSQGTPIIATEAGRVLFSGWADGYGNYIVIDHGGGFSSRYGHASRLLVRAGQKVKKGQTIAQVGSTGHSTGPHLHFELVSQGKHVNPLALLGRSIDLAAQTEPTSKAAI